MNLICAWANPDLGSKSVTAANRAKPMKSQICHASTPLNYIRVRDGKSCHLSWGWRGLEAIKRCWPLGFSSWPALSKQSQICSTNCIVWRTLSRPNEWVCVMLPRAVCTDVVDRASCDLLLESCFVIVAMLHKKKQRYIFDNQNKLTILRLSA